MISNVYNSSIELYPSFRELLSNHLIIFQENQVLYSEDSTKKEGFVIQLPTETENAIKTANRVNLVVKNPCSLPAQSSSGVSSSLSPGTAPQSKTRRSRKTTQSTTYENQSKKRRKDTASTGGNVVLQRRTMNVNQPGVNYNYAPRIQQGQQPVSTTRLISQAVYQTAMPTTQRVLPYQGVNQMPGAMGAMGTMGTERGTNLSMAYPVRRPMANDQQNMAIQNPYSQGSSHTIYV